MKAPSEFEAKLHDLEGRLDRLKSLYDQWFQGLERVPPIRQRERFDRDIRELRKRQPRNTALRFRFQTLYQRYTTLMNYWNRVTRQIEEGTYKRDLMRVRRRRRGRDAQRERSAAADVAIDVELDLDSMDLDAEIADALAVLDGPGPEPLSGDKTEPNIQVATILGAPPPSAPKPAQAAAPVTATFGRPKERPKPPPPPRAKPAAAAKPPPPPPPARRPPAAASQRATGDVDVKRIYNQYIEARRRNRQRTDNVKFEALERQIKQMVPKLQKKHRGKKIDFEVVVKDGKVGLKPVTKD